MEIITIASKPTSTAPMLRRVRRGRFFSPMSSIFPSMTLRQVALSSLLHAHVMIPLFFIKVFYGVAQSRAWHGAGIFIQKAQQFLGIFFAGLAQPPSSGLVD